ncbi:hypothetical protein B0H10DRAFT_2051590 [Mycena sp. CBHHK59/15]|nr:hypothetical protein B0H10DRAFT_2051590 [Mycena sp. CBHHK59/15]
MADLQVAPAPWKLKGRSWAFLLSPLPDKSSFPAGWATAYQAEALAGTGEFIGGPGIIQIVSYSESPVGPYDELIYVPGKWKYADGTKGFRITKIYVSTKESTMNGRKNWNIPKQVASFDIKTESDGRTDITVSHPGAPAPFFKVSIRSIPVLSALSVPTSTSIFGKFTLLVQPPLPAGDEPEEVCTSAQWATLVPALKGSASLRKLTPGLDGKIGDGVWFPAVVPWSVGLTMENLDMEFGIPTWYDGM